MPEGHEMNEIKRHRKDANGVMVDETSRCYIDKETGEEVWLQNVEKVYCGQRHFWKLYLFDFLAVLGIFNSKQLDVVAWICEHTQASNNMLIATYPEIAAGAGVSERWVGDVIRKLKQANFLRQKQPGVYMLNPEIMMRGSEAKKRGLLITYNESFESEVVQEAKEMGCDPNEGDPDRLIADAEVI